MRLIMRHNDLQLGNVGLLFDGKTENREQGMQISLNFNSLRVTVKNLRSKLGAKWICI